MAQTLSSIKKVELGENKDRVEKNIMQPQISAERKSLKTLQIGSDGKLSGIETKKVPLKKFAKSSKPVKVFLDKLEMGTQTDSAAVHEREAQTELTGEMRASSSSDCHNDSGVGAGDIDQEAYDLMVKEPIPEFYWRDIAEERRCSLAEALSENEMLHQSMEELKEENHNLSLLASQAEYLASVLNDVLGDKKDEENKDTETENDDKDTNKETDAEESETQTKDETTDKEESPAKQEKEN